MIIRHDNYGPAQDEKPQIYDPKYKVATAVRSSFAVIDGNLLSWGYNGGRELGLGSTTSPVYGPRLVPVTLPVTDVQCSMTSTACRTSANTVMLAGTFKKGASLPAAIHDPFLLTGNWQQKSLYSLACTREGHLVLSSSEASFLGWSLFGEAGTGLVDHISYTNAITRSGAKAIKIVAGVGHSAILYEDGSISTSGEAAWGCLAEGWPVGDRSAHDNRILLPGGKRIKDIYAGCLSMFAIDFDGGLWYVGQNRSSISGIPSLPAAVAVTTFQKVNVGGGGPAAGPIVKVAVSHDHALCLDEDGYVYGAGVNGYGQLGLSGASYNAFTRSAKLSGIVDIACGMGVAGTGVGHSLAVDSDGRVFGFGYNDMGQTGTQDASNFDPVILTLPPLPRPDGQPMPEEYMTNWPSYGEFLQKFEEATPGLKNWDGQIATRQRQHSYGYHQTSFHLGGMVSKDEVLMSADFAGTPPAGNLRYTLETVNLITRVSTKEFEFAVGASVNPAIKQMLATKDGRIIVLPHSSASSHPQAFGIYDPAKALGSRFTQWGLNKFSALLAEVGGTATQGVYGIVLPVSGDILFVPSTGSDGSQYLVTGRLDGEDMVFTRGAVIPTVGSIPNDSIAGLCYSLDGTKVYAPGRAVGGWIEIDIINEADLQPSVRPLTPTQVGYAGGAIMCPDMFPGVSDGVVTIGAGVTSKVVRLSDMLTTSVSTALLPNTYHCSVKQIGLGKGVAPMGPRVLTTHNTALSVYNNGGSYRQATVAGTDTTDLRSGGAVFFSDQIISTHGTFMAVVDILGIGKPHPSWQLHPYMNHS